MTRWENFLVVCFVLYKELQSNRSFIDEISVTYKKRGKHEGRNAANANYSLH